MLTGTHNAINARCWSGWNRLSLHCKCSIQSSNLLYISSLPDKQYPILSTYIDSSQKAFRIYLIVTDSNEYWVYSNYVVDHISMQQLFGWLWSDFDKIKELHFQQNMSVLSPFIGRSQLVASDGVGNIISPDSPSLVSIGLHSERPSLLQSLHLLIIND